LAVLRQFFYDRNVLEVETPLLCSAGVTDIALEPFVVAAADGDRYLQTSPEYAMKRLLAAGSGDIFQICKAFRAGELGRRHNPEYSLLEWYRLNMTHYDLIREVAELVSLVLDRSGWEVWPYRTLMLETLGVDVFLVSEDLLEATARERLGDIPQGLERDALLDLLMTHVVEPAMADRGVVFVVDYPATQAALARVVTVDACAVGCRFECYVDGVELANGYWEEQDSTVLAQRFHHDAAMRNARGLPARPIDQRLLAAQVAGLPACSGVALGVDRLLALQLQRSHLSSVISFDWSSS
jgi:lysyl-tRNA synthetase class 2